MSLSHPVASSCLFSPSSSSLSSVPSSSSPPSPLPVSFSFSLPSSPPIPPSTPSSSCHLCSVSPASCCVYEEEDTTSPCLSFSFKRKVKERKGAEQKERQERESVDECELFIIKDSDCTITSEPNAAAVLGVKDSYSCAREGALQNNNNSSNYNNSGGNNNYSSGIVNGGNDDIANKEGNVNDLNSHHKSNGICSNGNKIHNGFHHNSFYYFSNMNMPSNYTYNDFSFSIPSSLSSSSPFSLVYLSYVKSKLSKTTGEEDHHNDNISIYDMHDDIYSDTCTYNNNVYACIINGISTDDTPLLPTKHLNAKPSFSVSSSCSSCFSPASGIFPSSPSSRYSSFSASPSPYSSYLPSPLSSPCPSNIIQEDNNSNNNGCAYNFLRSRCLSFSSSIKRKVTQEELHKLVLQLSSLRTSRYKRLICSPSIVNLQLRTGAYDRPHVKKERTADVYFAQDVTKCIGIADGVSEWSTYGVDAHKFAAELMYACAFFSHSHALQGENLETRALKILERGYMHVKSYGSSTALVACLDTQHNQLGVANLGDSALLVLRRHSTTGQLSIIHRTREQQHFFNCPYQLSNIPKNKEELDKLKRRTKSCLLARLLEHRMNERQSTYSYGGCNHKKNNFLLRDDQPNDAKLYSFDVQEGDILVLATDGVLDNLFDYEITSLVGDALTPYDMRVMREYLRRKKKIRTSEENSSNSNNSCYSNNNNNHANEEEEEEDFIKIDEELMQNISYTPTHELAKKIVLAALERSEDKNIRTPFSKSANANSFNLSGGKADDMSCLVSYVVSSNERRCEETYDGNEYDNHIYSCSNNNEYCNCVHELHAYDSVEDVPMLNITPYICEEDEEENENAEKERQENC